MRSQARPNLARLTGAGRPRPIPPLATPAPQPAPAEGVAAAPAPAASQPETLTFPSVIAFPDRASEANPSLSPSQLAFLARKSAYLAGTGPLFPPESMCPACGGLGSHKCSGCDGNCVNPSDGSFTLPRGLVLEDARQFNGRIDVTTFLLPGGLCFYCKGTGVQGCVECEASGFRGGRSEMFTGD